MALSRSDLDPGLVLVVYYGSHASGLGHVLEGVPGAMQRLGFADERIEIDMLFNAPGPGDHEDRILCPQPQDSYFKTFDEFGAPSDVVQESVDHLEEHEHNLLACGVSSHAKRVLDGFTIHSFGMSYSADSWEDPGQFWGGFRLIITIFVDHCGRPEAAEPVMLEFLERAVACGDVLHGVIDLDYFIANGNYYDSGGYVPFLPERRQAFNAWTELRSKARDLGWAPREGIVLGPDLLRRYTGQSADTLTDRLAADGVEVDRLRVRPLPDGSVLLLTSPSIWDMSQSLRKNAEVRRVAGQLTKALIAAGIVAEGSVIEHVENPVPCHDTDW